MSDFTGKRVMVLGMARSGVAAAKLLAENGATVVVSDLKTPEALGEALAGLKIYPSIEWRLGERAEDALAGLDMLVVSPGVPLDHPAIHACRGAGVPVIGELELSYRLSRGRVIAITGTNGKTTTTALLGEIMKNAGKRTHVVGNIGFPYAAVAGQTRTEDVIVCEVSSFQLETIDQFHPSISAILNISEDHLNRHGSMDVYIHIKARVFENQNGEDVLVLNYDDPALREIARQANCRLVWFSRTGMPPRGAFVSEGAIVYGTPSGNRPICKLDEIALPGPHNVENALAAAAMAMCAQVPAPVIRHTLRTFQGVEHRLEFVRELAGVRFINDSKGTNVDSTIKAVDSMRRPTVLIAGGSDKRVDFAALCRRIADNALIARVVLIGQTAPQLARQLAEAGYDRFAQAGADFQAAVETAFALAQELGGGNVLLSPACASFDMFEDFEHRGRVFKEIVLRLAGAQRPG